MSRGPLNIHQSGGDTSPRSLSHPIPTDLNGNQLTVVWIHCCWIQIHNRWLCCLLVPFLEFTLLNFNGLNSTLPCCTPVCFANFCGARTYLGVLPQLLSGELGEKQLWLHIWKGKFVDKYILCTRSMEMAFDWIPPIHFRNAPRAVQSQKTISLSIIVAIKPIYSNVGRLFCTPAPPKIYEKTCGFFFQLWKLI